MKTSISSGLLTCEEAAEYLGVSVNTLANWRVTKLYNLPFIKLGARGYVRYRKTDIDKFLEEKTVRAA